MDKNVFMEKKDNNVCKLALRLLNIEYFEY